MQDVVDHILSQKCVLRFCGCSDPINY